MMKFWASLPYYVNRILLILTHMISGFSDISGTKCKLLSSVLYKLKYKVDSKVFKVLRIVVNVGIQYIINKSYYVDNQMIGGYT